MVENGGKQQGNDEKWLMAKNHYARKKEGARGCLAFEDVAVGSVYNRFRLNFKDFKGALGAKSREKRLGKAA